MTRLTLLCLFLCVVSSLPATSQKQPFLVRYLADPYSPIADADKYFSNPIKWSGSWYTDLIQASSLDPTNSTLPTVPPISTSGPFLFSQVSDLYLSGIQIADFNGDGLDDILIPARKLDGSIVGLILYNSPHIDVLGNRFSDVTSVPIQFSPAPSEPDSVRNLKIDINGDGLPDLIDIEKPDLTSVHKLPSIVTSPPTNGLTVTTLTYIFNPIRNVRINLGEGFVNEGSIQSTVRDARLGYIAAYVRNLVSGASDILSETTPHSDNMQRSLGPSQLLTASRADWQQIERASRISSRARSKLSKPPASIDGRLNAVRTRHSIHSVDLLLETYPEVDFRCVSPTGGAYIPNVAAYRIGMEQGAAHAIYDIGMLAKAKGSLQRVAEVIAPIEKLSPQSSNRTNVASEIAFLGDQARAAGDLSSGGNNYLQALSTVINSPILLPRKVDSDLKPVDSTDNGPVPARSTKMANDQSTRLLLRDLDISAIVTKQDNVFIINGARVVGTALAFETLNAMRGDPNYIFNLKPGNALPLLQAAEQDAAALDGPSTTRLSIFADVSDVSQRPATDFIMASMSSGYHDLAAFVAADAQAIAFDVGFSAGFDAGSEAALAVIKSTLGSQIPALTQASDIATAAKVISDFVESQQVEIARLNGVINDLRDTLKKLNDDLDAAHRLINDLIATNQALQDTLHSIAGAADSMHRFFNTGTGWLTAGPIGGIACALFCP